MATSTSPQKLPNNDEKGVDPPQKPTNSEHSYWIGGVQVKFPAKAYPSQLAMMDKVIRGLKRHEDCLLESPTGSGKTLALLCASLAWQKQEAARIEKFNESIEQMEIEQRKREKARKAARMAAWKESHDKKSESVVKSPMPESSGDFGPMDSQTKMFEAEIAAAMMISTQTTINEDPESSLMMEWELSDDDDFDLRNETKMKSSNVVNKLTPVQSKINSKDEILQQIISPQPSDNQIGNESSILEDEAKFPIIPKRQVVPKIYFGTRTHKQIAQITRELRKTIYKNVRSVVLSSREHTCINPAVNRLPNKNEKCLELQDDTPFGGGCGWYTSAKKLGTYSGLTSANVGPGYDLEDLVNAGREMKACPYYATRFLMETADLIICPYNYLIDPSVRSSMQINLKNQVVVLDEAHNIEDASRESASFSINQDDIITAKNEYEKAAIGSTESYALSEIAKFLSEFSGWMDKTSSSNEFREISYDSSGTTYFGTKFLATMDVIGLNPNRIGTIMNFFRRILAQRESERDQQRSKKLVDKNRLPPICIITLENILICFERLLKDEGLNRDDFRIALLKNAFRKRGSAISKLSFNFWCLNPAIIFQEFKSIVYNIILTSGTLSPMDSFASELGVPFPIKLEAPHVIDDNQIWVGAIGKMSYKGTTVSLNGSFNNAGTNNYMDAVGQLVVDICNVMPHGVLLFFSSYRALENMKNRWMMTGLYERLESVKSVCEEPRGNAAEFTQNMDNFYHDVKMTEGGFEANKLHNKNIKTGAIFLAVCRGKVSEGMDFADNNARVVICIGIPFPAYKDMQVEFKRGYNDSNRNKGLLSGSTWYEIQAFRAINQALGRCIRHRCDWGAILLVDERFVTTPRYTNSLSKWVRKSVQNFSKYEDMIESFTRFRNNRLAQPKAISFEILDKTLLPLQPLVEDRNLDKQNQGNCTLVEDEKKEKEGVYLYGRFRIDDPEKFPIVKKVPIENFSHSFSRPDHPDRPANWPVNYANILEHPTIKSKSETTTSSISNLPVTPNQEMKPFTPANKTVKTYIDQHFARTPKTFPTRSKSQPTIGLDKRNLYDDEDEVEVLDENTNSKTEENETNTTSVNIRSRTAKKIKF